MLDQKSLSCSEEGFVRKKGDDAGALATIEVAEAASNAANVPSTNMIFFYFIDSLA